MDRHTKNNNSKKTKLIAIVGPTASGKTALGVYLAKKFNGEIISADSRQVYKFMNIGTGKDLKEYDNIKYYCIDLIEPTSNFNLAKYVKYAKQAISKIQNKNKIPFLVGGTGLYINAIVENYDLNREKIDIKLRKELELKTKRQLQKIVLNICKKNKIKNPLNNSDWNNPYRLIRFIEKNKNKYSKDKKNDKQYDTLIIGIKPDKTIMQEKIKKRLDARLEDEDMLKEIWDLHYKHHVTWKRIISFGLEHRFIGQFLKDNRKYFLKDKKLLNINNLEKSELKDEYIKMKQGLEKEITHFAKKQMTWFKKNKDIIWLTGDKKEIYKTANKLVKKFILY